MERRAFLRRMLGAAVAAAAPPVVAQLPPVAAVPAVVPARGFTLLDSQDIIEILTRNMLLGIQAGEDAWFVRHLRRCSAEEIEEFLAEIEETPQIS